MEPVSVLSSILSAVSSVVTSAITWMGSFLSTITATGNEILLLFIILPLVGLGIGLIRRMIRL